MTSFCPDIFKIEKDTVYSLLSQARKIYLKRNCFGKVSKKFLWFNEINNNRKGPDRNCRTKVKDFLNYFFVN